MKLSKEQVSKILPKRPKDANKGTFGKVLVIAGSKNYPGAAYLVCAAAYRVGAGLVTLATSTDVKVIISRKLPEVTFLTFNEIFEKVKEYDVLLLGPGLGQDKQTRNLIEKIINAQIKAGVIDGDGLNIISKFSQWWSKLGGNLILTPHPEEMARLTNISVEDIQKDRETVAQKYADLWGQVVVLKGANTVVASPTGEVKISPFVNPVLATAGTGDVLAGCISGFLAQGLNPFDASCAGVYVHGLAGEIIKEKLGNAGMLASDLLPLIPEVVKLTLL